MDVLELVEAVGTPVFIYDEEHLRRRCREARQAFGPRGRLRVEGLPVQSDGRLAYEEGSASTCRLAGELAVALAAGCTGERLVLHGNNKSEAEIEAALTAGVGQIVVDWFDEIDRLGRLRRGRKEVGRRRVLLG